VSKVESSDLKKFLSSTIPLRF